MELKKSKTFNNLAKAYAGECMAKTRYEFIEYGARTEGYKNIAQIIDSVVYQEFNHARMLYTFIQTACEGPIDNIEICSGYPFKEKWNLLENLALAAADEGLEADRIYPEYAKIARQEGFNDIAGLFDNLVQVENCHRMLFQQLHDQMKDGMLYKKEESVKWKCSDCGYEAEGKKAFKICPLCQAKQGSIMLKLSDGA